MVKTKGNQQTVQETNDNSVVSKAYVAEHGYFDDPYLKLFCTKVARRSPLIQWGYYIRAKAMDHILRSFLQHCGGCKQLQIVSIGAGFDASYFRLKNLHLLQNSTYYDVDFPEVIERKINIIQKQSVLSTIIGEFTVEEKVLKSNDYYTIPSDVTDLNKLGTLLSQNCIDFTRPTLFFSECALTYVEYFESKKLCKWIQEKFQNVSFVLYEQIKPDDAFGHVMLRHFAKIQSPLKRINQLDSLTKQMSLFDEVGYQSSVGYDMNLFFEKCIDAKEKCRVEKLEVFDEFEEWHLKCSHYCIVGGFQGSCVGSLESLGSHKTSFTEDSSPLVVKTSLLLNNNDSCTIPIQRFGHSSTQLNQNTFLFTGGFGLTHHNKHNKLDDGFLMKFINIDGAFQVDCQSFKLPSKVLYHSLTSLSENVVFMFGGRQSPMQPVCEYGMYELLDGDESVLTPRQVFSLNQQGMVPGKDEPGVRWRHAAVTYGDYIYVSGGRSLDNVIFNDLWSFGLTSKKWRLEDLPPSLAPFHTHTLNVWNDNLVLYGGLTTHMKVLNQLLIINVKDKELNSSLIEFTNPLPPRYSHTSHVVNDVMYVIGGIDPKCCLLQPPVLIISLTNNTWKPVQLPACDPVRPLMLHNHCSALLEDENKIAIVGGGGNCFSFGSYFNPDISLLHLEGVFDG